MPAAIRYHGAACKTCRRRGRRCSRELPACNSCLDKGLECEGYALKWTGLASRGFLVGKKSPASKRNPASARKVARHQMPSVDIGVIDPSSPEVREDEPVCIDNGPPSPSWSPSVFQALEPITLDEIDNATDFQDDFVVDNAETTVPSHALVLQTPRPAMSLFEIPSDLGFILNYHICEVAAKLCVDNNALANPYRQYIYPLALQKPSLLYACAAMSSVHYSTCQNQDTFLVEALRLRGKALNRLQESMWSTNAAMDEGNLATILMLVLCDVCMGGHSNFEMYFTLAKRIIDARGAAKTADSFVEQYLSWLDVMSCASTQRKPVFTSDDIASSRGGTLTWTYDVIPCATDVFDIVQEAVTLHKEDPAPSDLAGRVENLKSRLLMSTPRTERGRPWLHLTEAYRHASLLYLVVLFELDVDGDEIDWLVSSIIQHAKSTPRRSGWSDQLLWPLFHAGLKIQDSRRQDWLRDQLQEMQSSGGFRNATSAIEALEKVWSGQFIGKYSDLLVEEDLGDLLVV